MLMPDVNVLVGAFRADSNEHDALRDWLESAVAGPELLALSDSVLGGTLRVLTHPKVFAVPTPLSTALDQIAALREADGVARVIPGERHWTLFDSACKAADARGNLVADAQHAALAIEHNAVWVTLDRDFARFPGLRWRSPLAGTGTENQL
jgi:toxin-antitoxin system PIN domain toxin